MLEAGQIKERIETALLPVRCVVEVSEYDQRVRVRIYNSDGDTILERALLLREARDDAVTDEFIRGAIEFLAREEQLRR